MYVDKILINAEFISLHRDNKCISVIKFPDVEC